MVGSTATMMPSTTITSSTAMMSGTPLGTIPTPVVASTTGTISPVSPLGSASTTVCSSTPGGPPTNGAALPLSTPQVPASPPLGTIEPAVADLGGTSIDPSMAPNSAMAVMPTPNTSACAESVTMNLGDARHDDAGQCHRRRCDAGRLGACNAVGLLTATLVFPAHIRKPGRRHWRRPTLKPYLMVRPDGRGYLDDRAAPPRLPPEAVVERPQSGRRTPRLEPPEQGVAALSGSLTEAFAGR